jgi:hypothetical protein
MPPAVSAFGARLAKPWEKLATQIAGVFRTPMPALQGDGNLLLE